jgi:hypothetical protein
MSEEEKKSVGRPPKEQKESDTVKKLRERIERLEYAASKAAVNAFDKRNAKPHGKEATVRTFNDKIIVGWKMTKDQVEKNPTTGFWVEDQRITLAFLDEDGMSDEIPYQTFVRRYKDLKVRILKESIEQDTGITIWTVETLEGDKKKFDIDIRFVN